MAAHHGTPETGAVPTREADGQIRIDAPATRRLFEAVHSGRRFMSVEFFALEERTTQTDVREVQQALVRGARVSDLPEYDSTAAEIREREPVRVWL